MGSRYAPTWTRVTRLGDPRQCDIQQVVSTGGGSHQPSRHACAMDVVLVVVQLGVDYRTPIKTADLRLGNLNQQMIVSFLARHDTACGGVRGAHSLCAYEV